MRQRLTALGLLACLAATGCSAQGQNGEADPPPAPSVGPAVQTEATAVKRAKAAVVDRTRARPQDIEVLSAERVEWPDSSLGCPRPGQTYLTVVTPGYQVLLSWAAQRYDVRVADGGHTRMCGEMPTKELRGVMLPVGGRTLGQAQTAARADLASRLGVPEEDVRFVGVQRRRFEDNSLGCPGSVEPVVARPVSGYVFTMETRGRRYTYHSDLTNSFPCPPILER